MKIKLLISMIFLVSYSQAEVKQNLGIDQSVDYTILEKLGPWDDRNYQVTAEDLKIIPENDQYLANVPLFFKVQVRKESKPFGDVYPRSTLQAFQIQYGGLLVNGIWYKEGLGIGYHPNDSYGKPSEEAVRATAANETALETGVSGNEVAIECNPTNPDICVAGSNASGGQRMYYSVDAGVTWTLSQINASSCCDPTVDWSSDGNIVYQADLSSSIGVRWTRSLDQGVTWEAMKVLTPSGSDKEWIHVDRSATSPHKDNVYLTYHNGNTMQFARSTDMGQTMSTPISFSGETTGIGSDITTDPAGNIYYVYASLTSAQGIKVLKSTDGGATFAPGVTVSPLNGRFDFPIPSMETREAFIYASTDVDTNTGDIYVTWTDEADDSTGGTTGPAANNHAWIQVAKSSDQGATWSMCAQPHDTTDTVLGGSTTADDGSPVDRFHPWVKVGENGVVHIVYYDTRHSPNRTGVDLFYTSSVDGCTSWTPEERYTTVTSTNISNGQEWGDYNGLSVVLDKLATSFTDNRPGGQTAMVASGINPKGSPTFSLGATGGTDIAVCSGNTGVSATIEVTALMDYNNPVTLSTTTTPAFVSNIAFATNPVDLAPNTTSVLTFDIGAGGALGNNVFTVEGTGDEVVRAITKSLNLNLIYSGGTTSATTLTAPADSATNVSLATTFTWETDANATSYRLMVSDDVGFANLLVDETVADNTFDVTGLPSATILYWRVSTQSGCNANDVVSATSTFSTTALPGDCAIGYEPIVSTSYDFEADEQGWTHSSISGTDAWALSTANPHSGTQAIHAAQNSSSDSVFVSPPINLPSGQAPLTLQFWNEQAMEDKTTGCYDGGLLEISTDGGNTFSPMPAAAMFSDPYDGPVTGLNDSDGWCGDPQAYLNSIVDIDTYAGQTVQFRFRVGNDGSVNHDGWDIDDIQVVGCQIQQEFNIDVVDTTINVCENDTGVGTTVNIATDGTYTGPVTLSPTTVPNFLSNIAFASNPVTPTPGTSAMTFDVGAGTVGSHTLTILGENSGIGVTDTTDIEVLFSEVSLATTLSLPADLSTDIGSSVLFSWAAAANATSYHLVVSTSPTFDTLIVDETLAGTTFEATALPGNATLYWRVDSQSYCNANDTASSVFSFTTAAVYCATVPVAITDNIPAGIDLTITTIDTFNLDNLVVSVSSDHTWPGDLIFTLDHNGTTIELMNRPGVPASSLGCSTDGIEVIFDDNSATPVEGVCVNPGGVLGILSPDEPLSSFNGQSFAGDWVLHVTDNAGGDSGNITEFCLTPTEQADLIFANGFEAP